MMGDLPPEVCKALFDCSIAALKAVDPEMDQSRTYKWQANVGEEAVKFTFIPATSIFWNETTCHFRDWTVSIFTNEFVRDYEGSIHRGSLADIENDTVLLKLALTGSHHDG